MNAMTYLESSTNRRRETMNLLARALGDRPRDALIEIDRRGWWNEIGVLACREQVGGLLFDRLRQLDHSISEDTSRELAAYARHVDANNRMQIKRVLPVVDAFRAAGIPCLVLKGAALLATAFGKRSMRPMVDVDLMIRAEDVRRAWSVLRELHWSAESSLVRSDFFPRFHYERGFVNRNGPHVRIDLHVRPFRPMRYAATIPPRAFWDRVQPASLDGHDLLVPDANAMLIHLAVHAACHGASQLRWLNDIVMWCRSCEATIDVDAIAAWCDEWKLTLPMGEALNAVRTAFGSIPIVDALLASLKKSSGWIDRLVLWQAPHGDRRHVVDVAVNALVLPGIRNRLAYLASVGFPDDSHFDESNSAGGFAWRSRAQLRRAMKIVGRPLERMAS